MAIKIERLRPRDGIAEVPLHEARGIKLAPPQNGDEKHHARHAVHAPTLEDAADLIEKERFSIWMHRPGKRASLICPDSLRITRT
jgi:hypothetical protein